MTIKLTPEAALYLETAWPAGTDVKVMTAEMNRMIGGDLTPKRVGWMARQRGLERPADHAFRKNRKLSDGKAFFLGFERASKPTRKPPEKIAAIPIKYPARGFSMLGGSLFPSNKVGHRHA